MADKEIPIPCTVKDCPHTNLAWYETVYREPPHMCRGHQRNAHGMCAETVRHAGDRSPLGSSCSFKARVQVGHFKYCKRHAERAQQRLSSFHGFQP